MPVRAGGEGRKWPGRLASAGFHFLVVALMGALGLVTGLIFASWHAMSSVAALRPASVGKARDFAPDFEPELSIASIWITSLATGGGIGLLVGLVLGIILARAFAKSGARKRQTSGDS